MRHKGLIKHTNKRPNQMSVFKNIVSGFRNNRNALSHAQRMDLINHLHRKSDFELNAMNISRNNIGAMVMQGAITEKY